MTSAVAAKALTNKEFCRIRPGITRTNPDSAEIVNSMFPSIAVVVPHSKVNLAAVALVLFA
jgi:hypothetical protein